MKEVHWSPVLKQNWHMDTESCSVRHWSQFDFGGLASPFLNLDHFRTLGPIFPPHPHAGISALTYLAEHSPGSMRNRDSLGGDAVIRPGDLHWTLAGAGVVHEETPVAAHEGLEGFQIFVNLKEKYKQLPPRSVSLRSLDAPRVLTPSGALVKVCAGSFGENHAPLEFPERTDIWDVTLEAGSSFPLALRNGSGGMLYAYEGSFTVDCPEPFSVPEGGVVAFRVHEDAEVIVRVRQPGRLLVLQGPRTDEPIVFQGPFVMTTEEAAEEAEERYQSGKMGHLDPS